jgi:hypothetical protein
MRVKPRTVHDSISEIIGITNLAFSKVLMLVMGPALQIFDSIKVKKVKNIFATLNLGIVREEAAGCAMLANEVFESPGHVRLKVHGVDKDSLRALSCQHRVGP